MCEGKGQDAFGLDPMELELCVVEPCEKSGIRKSVLFRSDTFISSECSEESSVGSRCPGI